MLHPENHILNAKSALRLLSLDKVHNVGEAAVHRAEAPGPVDLFGFFLLAVDHRRVVRRALVSHLLLSHRTRTSQWIPMED